MDSLGNCFHRYRTPLCTTGGAQLLRPLYPLCRGMPCKGIERQHMVSRNIPWRNSGCLGLWSVEKGTLLSVPQRTQLRNLLSSLSLWIKSAEKEAWLSITCCLFLDGYSICFFLLSTNRQHWRICRTSICNQWCYFLGNHDIDELFCEEMWQTDLWLKCCGTRW